MYSRNLFKRVNKVTYARPKKCEVPKFINIYFILILCIFGLDFGYKKTLRKYFRVMLSFVELCATILMCVILIWRISLMKFDYYMAATFFVQYLMHTVLLKLTKYNVYDLIMDVHRLDKDIMKAVNTKFAFVLYFNTIINFAVKQTLCVGACYTDNSYYCKPSFPGSWYCLPLIGLDGITIVQMLLCYYVYRSAKYVKICLRNCDIQIVQERYRAVVAYCDKIRPINSAFVSDLDLVFS